MRKHSTTTNLLECTHDWYVGLSNRKNIDIVYIDFSKASDSIVFPSCWLNWNIMA